MSLDVAYSYCINLTEEEKPAPLAQLADDCQEAYNEYKVYKEMSSTLSKVSTKV